MSNALKRRVRTFYKEYEIKTITLQSIKDVIKRQGYTIVEYNTICNTAAVTALIEALGVEEYCKRSKGFTYADAKYRLVFLHEALSEAEKLMVLAHEEGHIYCGHITAAPIIGRDVIEEHEANEFAHYLLYRDLFHDVCRQISLHRKKLCIIMVGIILIVVLNCAYNAIDQEEPVFIDDLYITSTGSKYHHGHCVYVKDKANIHRMTAEEFESGKYEPCGICLPHIDAKTEGRSEN